MVSRIDKGVKYQNRLCTEALKSITEKNHLCT